MCKYVKIFKHLCDPSSMCEMFKIFNKCLEHCPPLEIWNFNHVHVVANVWLIIFLFHRITLLTSTSFNDFFLAKKCHSTA